MSTRTANICARQPNGRRGLVWKLTMPRRTCRRKVHSLGHAAVVILEPALQTAKVIIFRGVGRGRQTRPDAICGRALRFECSRSMQITCTPQNGKVCRFAPQLSLGVPCELIVIVTHSFSRPKIDMHASRCGTTRNNVSRSGIWSAQDVVVSDLELDR